MLGPYDMKFSKKTLSVIQQKVVEWLRDGIHVNSSGKCAYRDTRNFMGILRNRDKSFVLEIEGGHKQ